MSTVNAHAHTAPGEPSVPTTVWRDPGPHDGAQLVIWLLTRLGAMP
ncbi:hypothetical protein ACIO93_35280 [Streptomyces sp. NPDC087903]